MKNNKHIESFGKFNENLNISDVRNRCYEVFSDVKLLIEASNEGEAAYKSDSILSSIESQIDFTTKLIEEISKEEHDLASVKVSKNVN